MVYLIYWMWTDPQAAGIALRLSFAPMSLGMQRALLYTLKPLVCNAPVDPTLPASNETYSQSTAMSIVERVEYALTPVIIGAGVSFP